MHPSIATAIVALQSDEVTFNRSLARALHRFYLAVNSQNLPTKVDSKLEVRHNRHTYAGSFAQKANA